MKEYHDLELRIIELQWDADDIYNDPMNGCPGDIAYYYNRKIDRMKNHSDVIEHRIPNWFKDWVYRKVQKASRIRHEQSMNLPWNPRYRKEQ